LTILLCFIAEHFFVIQFAAHQFLGDFEGASSGSHWGVLFPDLLTNTLSNPGSASVRVWDASVELLS